jgi:hypothetical protein
VDFARYLHWIYGIAVPKGTPGLSDIIIKDILIIVLRSKIILYDKKRSYVKILSLSFCGKKNHGLPVEL